MTEPEGAVCCVQTRTTPEQKLTQLESATGAENETGTDILYGKLVVNKFSYSFSF